MHAFAKVDARVLDAGQLLLEAHASQAVSLMLGFVEQPARIPNSRLRHASCEVTTRGKRMHDPEFTRSSTDSRPRAMVLVPVGHPEAKRLMSCFQLGMTYSHGELGGGLWNVLNVLDLTGSDRGVTAVHRFELIHSR
jgi:hypothetical protein